MRETSVPLAEILRNGASQFRASGVAHPARQALRLWSRLWDLDPGTVFLERDAEVEPERAAAYQEAIARRLRGEPAAYVVGWAGFRYLTLAADRRALIPRPETEGLVDQVLRRVRSGRVADIGAGTGCIALSLAEEGAFESVVGVEVSAGALDLARVNARRTGLVVTWVRGDLCQPLADASLDALVSNPPYLTVAEYERLDGGVKEWEPASALISGQSGLEVTVRLLRQARRVLKHGGCLALEIDSGRAARVARCAARLGWEQVEVHEDLFGRERYLLARRSDAA